MSGQYGTPDWTNTDAAPNAPGYLFPVGKVASLLKNFHHH
jgi:hypothetical protein